MLGDRLAEFEQDAFISRLLGRIDENEARKSFNGVFQSYVCVSSFYLLNICCLVVPPVVAQNSPHMCTSRKLNIENDRVIACEEAKVRRETSDRCNSTT
jgi:hypothetical protein